jgi:hypothetical protein
MAYTSVDISVVGYTSVVTMEIATIPTIMHSEV